MRDEPHRGVWLMTEEAACPVWYSRKDKVALTDDAASAVESQGYKRHSNARRGEYPTSGKYGKSPEEETSPSRHGWRGYVYVNAPTITKESRVGLRETTRRAVSSNDP